MPGIPAHSNNKEFLKRINDAHNSSRRTLRDVADLCQVRHSYIGLILDGQRRPRRDQLIVICWLGWNLDIYETELILKAGGYETLIDWVKAKWLRQESTIVDAE